MKVIKCAVKEPLTVKITSDVGEKIDTMTFSLGVKKAQLIEEALQLYFNTIFERCDDK